MVGFESPPVGRRVRRSRFTCSFWDVNKRWFAYKSSLWRFVQTSYCLAHGYRQNSFKMIYPIHILLATRVGFWNILCVDRNYRSNHVAWLYWDENVLSIVTVKYLSNSTWCGNGLSIVLIILLWLSIVIILIHLYVLTRIIQVGGKNLLDLWIILSKWSIILYLYSKLINSLLCQ